MVKEISKLAESIHSAFHIAKNGRPGPVLVDIPKDIQTFETKYGGKKHTKSFAFYKPNTKPSRDTIVKFVNLLENQRNRFFTLEEV